MNMKHLRQHVLDRERERNQQIVDNDWDIHGIPQLVIDRWEQEDKDMLQYVQRLKAELPS